MQKVIKYIVFFLVIQSCATKKYVDKEQLKGSISNITEITYSIENDTKQLVTRKEMQLTKNGRIKYSETFNANNERIETTEKKLFFEKKSFPNKEAYYCKTRWKPGQRERISCYTQKQYKENEIIVHYKKDGTIDFIKDNFTNFHTYGYRYGEKDKQLQSIITLDKKAQHVEQVSLGCLTKDNYGNCLKIEKDYFKAKKKELVERTYKYY